MRAAVFFFFLSAFCVSAFSQATVRQNNTTGALIDPSGAKLPAFRASVGLAPIVVETSAGVGTSYATLALAKAAAVSGNTTRVGPGTYNERNIAKTGVALDFSPGANVVYTGAVTGGLLDDGSNFGTAAAIVTFIRADTLRNEGTGEFVSGAIQPVYDTLTAIVNVRNASSDVTIHARTLGSAHNFDGSAIGCLLNQSNGKLTVNVGRMLGGNYSNPIYWWDTGGQMIVNVDRLEYTDDGSMDQGAIVTGVENATGEFYLRGHDLLATNNPVFEHQPGDATGRIWVTGVANIVGGNKAIYGQGEGTTSASRHYYIGCGKISTTLANSRVIDLDNGVYWMEFQKLTIPDGGQYGINLGDDSPLIEYLEIGHLECLGSATNILRLGHANVIAYISIKHHVGTATSGGILVSGGTLYLRDSFIDTSANNAPTLQGANGTTIWLHNVHLRSHGSANSIAPVSGTMTVKCTGSCSVNRPVAAGVTIVGTLIEDSSL